MSNFNFLINEKFDKKSILSNLKFNLVNIVDTISEKTIKINLNYNDDFISIFIHANRKYTKALIYSSKPLCIDNLTSNILDASVASTRKITTKDICNLINCLISNIEIKVRELITKTEVGTELNNFYILHEGQIFLNCKKNLLNCDLLT